MQRCRATVAHWDLTIQTFEVVCAVCLEHTEHNLAGFRLLCVGQGEELKGPRAGVLWRPDGRDGKAVTLRAQRMF